MRGLGVAGWKRVLKGILIKHCYFCTRPWCQHTHHHHHPRPSSPATRAESVDQSQPRVWPEWLVRPPIGCRGGNWSSATNESRDSRCKARNQFPTNCGWMITKGETITGRTWCKFQYNGSHNVYKLHGANFSTFLHGLYWLYILLRPRSNNWNKSRQST